MILKKNIKKSMLVTLMTVLLLTTVAPALAIQPQTEPATHGQIPPRPEGPTFSGGDGSPTNPYLLSNLADLIAFSAIGDADHSYTRAAYKLTANIDLASHAWQAPGWNRDGFHGSFDGSGYSISIQNLAPDSRMGFWGRLGHEGQVRNLTIKANINQSLTINEDLYFGLIAAENEGQVENCITMGQVNLNISGGDRVSIGGMFGRTDNVEMKSLLNQASLNLSVQGSRELNAAPIIGDSFRTVLQDVTNQGSLDLTFENQAYVAGIVARAYESDLENILNQGNLSITMLTRVYKAAYWDGWTLDTDATYSEHKLDSSGFTDFSDHQAISSYARDSVYFMAKHNILAGTGNNIFSPQNLATREQAFKIAVATIEELRETR